MKKSATNTETKAAKPASDGRPAPTPRPKLAAKCKEHGSWEGAAFFLRERGVQVSSSYLSMLSSGTRDPSLAMMKALCKAFGLRQADIAGE